MEVEQSQIVSEDVAHPLEQEQEVQQIQGEGLSSLPPSALIEVSKRKPSRKPSTVWKDFKRVNDKAIGKYCGKQYAANSGSHGTTNMHKHLKVCLKNPNRVVDKKQKTIAIGKESEDDPNSVSLKLVDFNQERTRLTLAKMIIIDELPFKYVENEGFNMFMKEAQPRFKIPSRVTVARDCLCLYFDEKEKLKSMLSANKKMVSLTTDTWTSIQNMNYMCVTAHYIDDEWNLKKSILSFGIIADHKGETIGITLENCMKEWGIKSICCATLSFSGSLHVTANSFFKQLMDIKKTLNKWRHNVSDPILKTMTANMQLKYNKYWESNTINYLLFVAIYLDPRYKLDYIEFCFTRMYGEKLSEDMLKKLKSLIAKLFEHYLFLYPVSHDGGSNASSSNIASHSRIENGEDDEDWDNLFRMNMKKKQCEVQKNELERYLEDGVEDDSPTFNILTWWKGKTNKYHVLSRIARDILAIPVSTVSSESAFSTGGRVLDSFRSSLNPSTVEALICTQNWIKSPKVIDLEKELVELEKVESELAGLVSIDVGITAVELNTTVTTRF
ncbi:unnamed protein product [Lathyrus sativus]|nr:unnamed protein product [Lathyrus sativus]